MNEFKIYQECYQDISKNGADINKYKQSFHIQPIMDAHSCIGVFLIPYDSIIKSNKIITELVHEMALIVEDKVSTINDNVYRSNIIALSPCMSSCMKQLDEACKSELTICLTGEHGVGKRLFARSIHEHGPRKQKPYVVLDCNTISSDIMFDSELFGHRRGAFAGAFMDKSGLIEVANHGSLYIHSAEKLSSNALSKLVQVAQNGTFLRIGDEIPTHVNTRLIISWTEAERSSDKEKTSAMFGGMKIEIPPLRQRHEDIPRLVQYFLNRTHLRMNMPQKSVSDEAMDVLKRYSWPGNVRELEQEVQRMAVISGNETVIPAECIREELWRTYVVSEEATKAFENCNITEDQEDRVTLAPGQNLQSVLDDIERRMIALTLTRYEGNRTKTAEVLGISRRNLIRKIESLGIKDFPGSGK